MIPAFNATWENFMMMKDQLGDQGEASISYRAEGTNGEYYERHARRKGAIIVLGTQMFRTSMRGAAAPRTLSQWWSVQ